MLTATFWTAPEPTATRRTRTRRATSLSRVTTLCPPSPHVLCQAVGGPGLGATADIGGQGETRRRPGRGTERTPSPMPQGTMKGGTGGDHRQGRAQREHPRPRNTASRTSDLLGPLTRFGPHGSHSSEITNESSTGACAGCCWESVWCSWFWEFLE